MPKAQSPKLELVLPAEDLSLPLAMRQFMQEKDLDLQQSELIRDFIHFALNRMPYMGKIRRLVTEGPIGVGKTTLLIALHKQLVAKGLKSTVSLEDIPESMLKSVYTEAKKYAMGFQGMMGQERTFELQQGRMRDPETLHMVDRGRIGSVVFSLIQHHLGNIDEDQFEFYKTGMRHLDDMLKQWRCPEVPLCKETVVLCLWMSAENCFKRMNGRCGVEAEVKVSLDYLQLCDLFHLRVMLVYAFLTPRVRFQHSLDAPKKGTQDYDKWVTTVWEDCNASIDNRECLVNFQVHGEGYAASKIFAENGDNSAIWHKLCANEPVTVVFDSPDQLNAEVELHRIGCV